MITSVKNGFSAVPRNRVNRELLCRDIGAMITHQMCVSAFEYIRKLCIVLCCVSS